MAEPEADPAGPALLPLPIPAMDHLPPFAPDLAERYRTTFRVGSRLGARGCVVLDADPAGLAAAALRRLIQPDWSSNFASTWTSSWARNSSGSLSRDASPSR